MSNLNQESPIDQFGLVEWSTSSEAGYYKIELWFFLILFAILVSLLIILIWKNFKHRELSERWLLLRMSIALGVGAFIMLIFIFEIIVIKISINGNNTNFIWTILITIIMGMFMNLIGMMSSMKQANKIILLMFVVALSLMGFGFFGFLIIFNVPFLVYTKYESNSIRGIYFLTANLVFMFLVYIISFISESEVKN